MELAAPALQVDSSPLAEPPGKPPIAVHLLFNLLLCSGKSISQCEDTDHYQNIFVSLRWWHLDKVQLPYIKWSLGRGRWPCDSWSGFLRLYLGQLVHQICVLWATIGEDFDIHCFPHKIIFFEREIKFIRVGDAVGTAGQLKGPPTCFPHKIIFSGAKWAREDTC